MRRGLALPSSHVQYDRINTDYVSVSAVNEGINIRQFIAESYPPEARKQAWAEILAELHLQSVTIDNTTKSFSSVVLYGDRDAIVFSRLVASAQDLVSVPQRSRVLMGLIPTDEDISITGSELKLDVPAGHLLVLQMDRPWTISLPTSVRLAAFTISDALLQRRGAGWVPFAAPRRYTAKGLASVFIRTVEEATRNLDALSSAEWMSLEQFAADLFVTMMVESDTTENQATPGPAALFNRITLVIEKRLHDSELSAGRIARLAGISERYMQKLFEQNGESFTHYLRERRLQRARAALVTPASTRLPVADVAYSCGFGDAANFNRMFKERFGLPPGAFRSHYFSCAAERGGVEQRGWPVKALSSKKAASTNLEVNSGALRDKRPIDTSVQTKYHHLRVAASTVHWGYFSSALIPVLEIGSGDTVEVETLTQHASDDPNLMIVGDSAAEDVFHWTKERKAVDRRGAGPIDASVFGRGAGEGFGVHICTGPIYIRDAEPGDVIEVQIEDMFPRPSCSPGNEGRFFGSNVAAWWGYHYNELIEPIQPREIVTIYEIFPEDGCAEALYSYRWSPQVDPYGVLHRTYDYPGVPVDKSLVEINNPVLRNIRIPIRPHFGVIALAPRETDFIDSVPPAYFGGNLDNWRLGKGSSVYLPVSAHGGLLSIGDPHAAQGDGELSGTAIECSMTGRFRIVLHKKNRSFLDLTYPLIETPDEWVLTGFSHPDYLAEFGMKGQGEVYAKSSLDLAMKDAFRKMRRFLMGNHNLSEDEAISLMSAAVDFGVTQVVDGNWGVHAIVRKSLFQVD